MFARCWNHVVRILTQIAAYILYCFLFSVFLITTILAHKIISMTYDNLALAVHCGLYSGTFVFLILMCLNGNLYSIGILTILAGYMNNNRNFLISICSIFISLHLELISCKNRLHIWITFVSVCIFCIACPVICTMLMLCLITDWILLCIITAFYIICKFLRIPMITRKSLSLGIKYILIPCINFSRFIPL